MSNNELPIYIIVGAARSGTTYLASLISNKDVCYLEEPNIIWMYRNASAKDDCLTAEDASSKIIRYIQNRFAKKFLKSNATCLLEKTPSNCLRLPFVQKVFPQAKYIFVERDVGDIAASAYKKWVREEDPNTERLYGGGHKKRQFLLMVQRFFSVSFLDIVHYWPKIRQELSFFVFGRRRAQWGPRYVGMAQDLDNLSIEDVCLKQAEECQAAATRFRSTLKDGDYIVVKYEDMKMSPDKITASIQTFMGIGR